MKNILNVLTLGFWLFPFFSSGQAPDWLWGRTVTGSYGYCWSRSIATDASGNIYVAGIFDGCYVTFDTTTITNISPCSSNEDIFLVKYDPNGNVIWAKQAAGMAGDWANAIALDASGNIYMVGSYSYSNISFGSVTLPSTTGTNMFLVKYDNNGNAIWAKNAGSLSCSALSVKVGSTGNIYVSGCYNTSTITFGSITLNNNNSLYDYFLTKYDINGNVVWAKSAGGARDEFAYSIDLDNSENIYVTGKFNSLSFNIGSTTLTLAGGSYTDNDIFLAKYSSNGNVLWATSTGGTGDDIANAVSVDSYGNAFVAGTFTSPSLTFGTATLINASSQHTDMCFLKYDNNGNPVWADSYGGTNDDYSLSVAIDNSNNVYYTGSYSSLTMVFGSYTLTHYPLFIVKYDNSGNMLWAKDPDSKGGYGHRIAVDNSGNVIIGGSYGTDSLVLGSTTLYNSATDFPLLLAKLSNFSANTTQTNVTCYGGSDGTATAGITGGTPPFSYEWGTTPPQTTQTITGLSAGMYSVTVTDSSGFYSIAYVNITQPNEIHSILQHTVCIGDSFSFNGNFYSIAGSYYDTLTALNGCDSIAELSLSVDPLDTTYISYSICQNTSYNFYGDTITSTGIYYHTLYSVYGCDSVLSMDISIDPVFSTNNPQTICSGNSYILNGHTYVNPGNYIDTLLTYHGCDSIITTNLTVNPVYMMNNPQVICYGESYTFNGHTYTSTGNYNDTLSTTVGCDSIIITQLTVNPTYLVTNSQIICSGDSFIFNGNSYYLSGNYYDSLTTIQGCDSIIELSLFVAPLDTTTLFQSICQGSTYNFYGNLLTTDGIYHNTLVSIYGCDSVIVLNLNVNPLPVVDVGFDTTIFLGNSTHLYATGGVSYEWTPHDFLNDPYISNPVSTPQYDITYIVYVTDINGCTVTDSVNVFVEVSNIWVPNVFNPNNPEPLNQKFYVRAEGIMEFKFVVYDRWGEKVFETNDINQGWDGTYKGKPLPSAVFTYYIEAMYYNSERVEKKGDVTLLR